MGANHADFFAHAPGGEDRTFAEVKDIEPAANYGDNFKGEDEGYLAASQGRNTGVRIGRERTDQPIASFKVRGKIVPFNHVKMYEDWRASKNDPKIPSWHELGHMDKNNPTKETPEHQADWQFFHPEGKALMAAAKKKAFEEGPQAFDSDFKENTSEKRASRKNISAISTVFPSQEKADHFKQTGQLQDMSDPDNKADETDYHKAWFAHITSRPEVGYATHAEATNFEGIHNLIHTAVKSATGSTPESLPQESQVGQHATAGLAALSRAAMHHTFGNNADATREMNSAAQHVQRMMSTIKGGQMSSGVGVSAAPAPEVSSAARFAANYVDSVKVNSKFDSTKTAAKLETPQAAPAAEESAAPSASNQRIANQRMGRGKGNRL